MASSDGRASRRFVIDRIASGGLNPAFFSSRGLAGEDVSQQLRVGGMVAGCAGAGEVDGAGAATVKRREIPVGLRPGVSVALKPDDALAVAERIGGDEVIPGPCFACIESRGGAVLRTQIG